MVNDLLQIFRKAENMEKAVFDNYIPKDGTYFRLDEDGSIKRLVIKRNQTEQNELYEWFKRADYYSCLIDMNKPVDSSKKIHSNNYLSVFVKCDIFPEVGTNKEKVMKMEEWQDTLERYFSTFLEGSKDKKVKKIIEILDLKEINQQELEESKNKIKQSIPIVIQKIKEEQLADKNYIKIFVKKDIEEYQREGNRYLYPRIFNKNDYNVEINGEIWGLSNDNMRFK